MPTYIEELIVEKLQVDELTIKESLAASGSASFEELTAGTLTSTGQAVVNDLFLSDTVWEDMRYPATRTKLGANDRPDFDFTNIGLLFPQNNTDEKIYITDQTPHAMYNTGAVFKPHIHYIQDEAGFPTFKLSQRVYQNGVAPGSFSTITTTGEGIFTYTSGSILQIIVFPDIEFPDSFGVSTWFDFILYRDDNVVSGDVLFKGFDCHYPVARLGSREVYSQ